MRKTGQQDFANECLYADELILTTPNELELKIWQKKHCEFGMEIN